LIDAAKQLTDSETKRSIIDPAQEIANGIKNSPFQSSLGSFVFQCNANVILKYVLRNDVGEDVISCHETAVKLPVRPSTASAQKTRITNKLFEPSSKPSSLLRRPATADNDQRSRVEIDSRLEGLRRERVSTIERSNSLGITSTQQVQGGPGSGLQITRRSPNSTPKLSGDQTSTADSTHSLGNTQHELADFSSALQSAQRALDIRRKLFGEEHSSTADGYYLLGVTQHELGDFSSALQSKQRALDIRRKLFGEEHSSTADSYYSLGVTQDARGDSSSALQSKQRALDIRLKRFEEEH